jgi:hypothetical protein
MSKKRRKRHEQQELRKPAVPTRTSVSTLGDFFSEDLRTKLKEDSKRTEGKTYKQAPVLKQGSPSNQQIPLRSKLGTTRSGRQVGNSNAPRKISSAPTELLSSLADVVTGAGLRRPRSLGVRRKHGTEQKHLSTESEVRESAARQLKYNEIIQRSLSEVFSQPIDINLGIDLGLVFQRSFGGVVTWLVLSVSVLIHLGSMTTWFRRSSYSTVKACLSPSVRATPALLASSPFQTSKCV